MMNTHKLLDCPFCGQIPSLKPSVRGDYTSILCEGDLACNGPLVVVIPNDKIAEGVAAWNRRATGTERWSQSRKTDMKSGVTLRGLVMRFAGVAAFLTGAGLAAAVLVWALMPSGAKTDAATTGFAQALWTLLVGAVVSAFLIVLGWHLIKDAAGQKSLSE